MRAQRGASEREREALELIVIPPGTSLAARAPELARELARRDREQVPELFADQDSVDAFIVAAESELTLKRAFSNATIATASVPIAVRVNVSLISSPSATSGHPWRVWGRSSVAQQFLDPLRAEVRGIRHHTHRYAAI